jgi:hypothetical protein
MRRTQRHSAPVKLCSPEHRGVTIYTTVTPDGPGQVAKHCYSTTEYDLSNHELRAKVLQQALRELRMFRLRYMELSELAPVLKAIQRTLKSVA